MNAMTPKTPPGKTREQIYRFVRARLLEGLPPTVREVQEHFGFQAVQTAHEHLRRLVAEGRLIKQKGKARGYALPEMTVAKGSATLYIPLLGRVPAGGLDAAIEDTEGYIPVQTRGSEAVVASSRTAALEGGGGSSQRARGRPPQKDATAKGTGLSTSYQATQPAGSGQLFALRVHGESMIGIGIFPGDIVIVRSQPVAQSGDIVVALIGDEATVKRLRLRRGRIELHPENPAFEPIIPGPDECTILGKVVETRRYFETPTL
jgi:repressor LexA